MYIYYLYTRYSYLFIYLFIYLFVCLFFIYTHVCVCICLPAAPKYAWCYLVPPNYILLSSTFLSLLGNPQTIATNRPTRRLLVNQSTHFVSRSYCIATVTRWKSHIAQCFAAGPGLVGTWFPGSSVEQFPLQYLEVGANLFFPMFDPGLLIFSGV